MCTVHSGSGYKIRDRRKSQILDFSYMHLRTINKDKNLIFWLLTASEVDTNQIIYDLEQI